MARQVNGKTSLTQTIARRCLPWVPAAHSTSLSRPVLQVAGAPNCTLTGSMTRRALPTWEARERTRGHRRQYGASRPPEAPPHGRASILANPLRESNPCDLAGHDQLYQNDERQRRRRRRISVCSVRGLRYVEL